MSLQLRYIERALEEECTLHGILNQGLNLIQIKREGEIISSSAEIYLRDSLIQADEGLKLKLGNCAIDSQKLEERDCSVAIKGIHNLLLQGISMDAYLLNHQIIVDLKGLVKTQVPDYVIDAVRETGHPQNWVHRRHVFRTEATSGPKGLDYVTNVVGVSKDYSEELEVRDPWVSFVVRTGRSETFLGSLESAINAQSVEVL